MRRTATGARVTEVTVMGVVTGKATTSTVAVALTVGEVSPGGPFRRQDWSCRPPSYRPPPLPPPPLSGPGPGQAQRRGPVRSGVCWCSGPSPRKSSCALRSSCVAATCSPVTLG